MSGSAVTAINNAHDMATDWVVEILQGSAPAVRHGRRLVGHGRPRAVDLSQGDQAPARATFAFNWAKRGNYASMSTAGAQVGWLDSRYRA